MYDSDDFTDLGPKVDNIDIEEVSLDVKMRSIDSILLKLGDPIEDKVKDKTMWRIDIVQKGNTLQIERSFSDFQWLCNNIRANDTALFMPCLGKGSFNTYLNTKWLKDPKYLNLRRDNLKRFLRKIQKKPTVLNSKVFQIFSSETYLRFEIFKTQYQKDRAPAGKGIFSMMMGVKDKMLSYITPESELASKYKERFGDIEEYLGKVIKSFSEIFEAHTEYLNALKEFLPEAVAEDVKYNEQVEKLLNILLLFRDQIAENKAQAIRERNRDEFDRFKQLFEEELATYKKELKEQIKKVCEDLSDLNARSAKLIQATYNQKFTIDL